MQTLPRFNVKHPTILSLDMLQKEAPAIFAERPAEHVSEEYQFIRTGDILESLQSKGWQPIFAAQQKKRGQEHKGEHSKHALSLIRQGETVAKMEIGGLLPTINIVNSHNWSSTFQIVFGMLRLVCSNGLMVGGASFQSFTLRHDTLLQDLEMTLARFESSVGLMMQKAEIWAQIGLDSLQVQALAMGAAKIRFGEEATEDHARALIQSRRSLDASNSLWNVYNRLQENGLKGGFRGGLNRRVRAVSNIQKVRDYNTQLFELADNLALGMD